MCGKTISTHPCGHHTVETNYCRSARIHSNGRTSCHYRDAPLIARSSSFCSASHCDYRRVKGKWRCHKCKKGPNTGGECLRRRGDGRICGHWVCPGCEGFVSKERKWGRMAVKVLAMVLK